MRPDVFIVAGEASSDLHAAELLKALRRLHPDMRAFGIGGEKLAEEGLEILFPAAELSVVGIADWLDKARSVLGIYRETVRAIEKRRPSVAVLLDLPDFNLRIARRLKALGIPVVYYISPQVWAWRKYRVRTIKKFVNQMLVVFPFEKEFYDREGVACEFVGHPLLETIPARTDYREGDEVRKAPRIALLPGSRKSELRYHQELIRQTVEKIRLRYPQAQFILPIASTLSRADLEAAFQNLPINFTSDSRESLASADLALVASGTATLETALIGTPFLLFYQVSRSSHWIFKYLIRYSGFIGMPNILLGREVAREFLQAKATAEALSAEVFRLIEDDRYREGQGQALQKCREFLGTEGASKRAAYFVHQFLKPPFPRSPSPGTLELSHAPVST